MTRFSTLLFVLGAGAATSCAATETANGSPQAQGPGRAAPGPEGAIDVGAVSVAEANYSPQPKPAERGAQELALWKDVGFRKRFVEGYLSETDIEPRVTALEMERLQEVAERMEAEDPRGAVALLERHGGEAASAVFDFNLGMLYFELDELERSERSYQKAVEKHPKFLRAWRYLGMVRTQLGAHDRAVEALTKVLELGRPDSVTYGLLGYAYANLENSLSSESAYRQAVLLDPESLDWKMGLARSLFRQERYADAIALTGQLIESDPERSELWLLQATAFLSNGEALRAAENFELVSRLGGATTEHFQLLGDIYIKEELYDLAVDAYQRAIASDSKADVARATQAARFLMARGASEQTRRLVRDIELAYADDLADEERKSLLKLRARLAVADGADTEEAAILEQVVELDPLDGEALILLGRQAQRTNEPERAVFYFERAASIEKFEAAAKLRHAQLLVSQGKYAEALPLLRRAQALAPTESVEEYLAQVERIALGR